MCGRLRRGFLIAGFITVGLLLEKLKLKNDTKIRTINNIVPDNWIYIQEADVKVGRLQIFNNWSPYMVKDKDKIWIGLEYFCNEGDQLWNTPDDDFIKLAIDEMAKINIIDKQDVLDAVVIKMPNAYPGLFRLLRTFQRHSQISPTSSIIFFLSEEPECTDTTTRTTQCFQRWLPLKI